MSKYNSFEMRVLDTLYKYQEECDLCLFNREIDLMHAVKDGLLEPDKYKIESYKLTDKGREFIEKFNSQPYYDISDEGIY